MENLLEILGVLREDFEMLRDGRWDLNYSDDESIEASLENVDKCIEIVKEIKSKL